MKKEFWNNVFLIGHLSYAVFGMLSLYLIQVFSAQSVLPYTTRDKVCFI